MTKDERNIRRLSFLFYETLFIAALVFLFLYRGSSDFVSYRGLLFVSIGVLTVPFIMSGFSSVIHKGIGLVLFNMVKGLKGEELVRYLKWVGRFILLFQMIFCFSMTFFLFNVFFH